MDESEEVRFNAIMISERQKILADDNKKKEQNTTMQHYYGQNRVNLRESKSVY